MAAQTHGAPERRRFTADEYERMIDAGVFGPGDRVELIEGEILRMSPEKSQHAAAIDLVAEALRLAFGAGYTVRVQHPLALGAASEPEPDVAVVRGSPRDYAAGHPSSALLVVEVADSSLAYDRSAKALLYAEADLVEYWIVNLRDACVEVHRVPTPQGYRDVATLRLPANVAALAAPHASIRVADLLP